MRIFKRIKSRKGMVSQCQLAENASQEKKNDKGYSLVELTVVLIILGILAGLGTVAFQWINSAQNTADAERIREYADGCAVAITSGSSCAQGVFAVAQGVDVLTSSWGTTVSGEITNNTIWVESLTDGTVTAKEKDKQGEVGGSAHRILFQSPGEAPFRCALVVGNQQGATGESISIGVKHIAREGIWYQVEGAKSTPISGTDAEDACLPYAANNTDECITGGRWINGDTRGSGGNTYTQCRDGSGLHPPALLTAGFKANTDTYIEHTHILVRQQP